MKKNHGERYYKKHSGNGYENKTDANRTPRVHEILRQDDEVAERAPGREHDEHDKAGDDANGERQVKSSA